MTELPELDKWLLTINPTELDKWLFTSEAAGRFYKAIVEIEYIWKWIKLTRFRYIQWRKKLWFKEFPPLSHAGVIFDNRNSMQYIIDKFGIDSEQYYYSLALQAENNG